MATNFNTEDMATLRGARVTSVDKVSEIRSVQSLPQHGKDLPEAQVEKSPDPEQIEQAVGIMNDHVQQVHRQLQFSVDDDSGRIVITVIDGDTDEVIRQIPGEEALNYARKLIEGADLEIFDNFA